jgi:hypothetical protein
MKRVKKIQPPVTFFSMMRALIASTLRTIGKPIYYLLAFGLIVFPLLILTVSFPTVLQTLFHTVFVKLQSTFHIPEIQSFSTGILVLSFLEYLGLDSISLSSKIFLPRELVTENKLYYKFTIEMEVIIQNL